MRVTQDNVLLVTLKNNQHTLSLQLLPKSAGVCLSISGCANPCDGPPDRRAGHATKFPQSSWITTREAPFRHQIVLVCRPSRPKASLIVDGLYDSPAQAVNDCCDSELWLIWLAVNYWAIIGTLSINWLSPLCLFIEGSSDSFLRW